MINIIVSSDSRYPVNKELIKKVVTDCLNSNSLAGNVEVEVSIVGDRKMKELNNKYRKLNETTDVLSFGFGETKMGFIASPDNILRLGMIVISYPQALQNAYNEGKTLDSEIAFLVDHGTKHLLGIHHE